MLLVHALSQGPSACFGDWQVEKTLKTPKVGGQITQKQQVVTVAKGFRQVQQQLSSSQGSAVGLQVKAGHPFLNIYAHQICMPLGGSLPHPAPALPTGNPALI